MTCLPGSRQFSYRDLKNRSSLIDARRLVLQPVRTCKHSVPVEPTVLYSARAAAGSQEVCHPLAGRIEAARFEEMVGSRAFLAGLFGISDEEVRNEIRQVYFPFGK